MKKFYFLAFYLMINLCVYAQDAKTYQVDEIDVVKSDDGRMLFRELNEKKTPLQGKLRIIDEHSSEYKIANFKDGMYNGEYEYYKDKTLREKGNYVNGRKDGLYTEYDASGHKKTETPCKNGKVDGIKKTYFTNGTIESEKGFKMSVEDGIDINYEWENHKQIRKMNYKNGVLDGKLWQQIYSNVNNYTLESNYLNDKLDGDYCEIYTSGNGTGKIRQKGKYSNGEKVGEWVDNREKYDNKDENH